MATPSRAAYDDRVLEFLENDRRWLAAAIGGVRERAYCGYHRYGEEPGALYIVARCQAGLAGSTASVLPAALTVSGAPGAISVTDFTVPRDGSLNGPDVRRIFPAAVARRILNQVRLPDLAVRAEARAVAAAAHTGVR